MKSLRYSYPGQLSQHRLFPSIYRELCEYTIEHLLPLLSDFKLHIMEFSSLDCCNESCNLHNKGSHKSLNVPSHNIDDNTYTQLIMMPPMSQKM